MNARTQKELDWATGYYSQLIGFTVKALTFAHEEGKVWTSLICQKTNDEGHEETFVVEISQDPEGNGPGFLFGLPSFMVK